MAKTTPVKQSPKPATGKKQKTDARDAEYATDQMMDYYNR